MREILFERYLELLLKWSRTYNLTAITDPEEIRVKHFEDSLSLLPFLPSAGRLLDIGTGAGFPGIPIKIERPDLEVVLLDSQRKKISFCAEVIRRLGLQKISACHGRAEDPKTIKALGFFEAAISRALFSIPDFLKIAKPYLQPGGIAIAMKGENWMEEYAEDPAWILKEVCDYALKGDRGKRSLPIFVLRTAQSLPD